jgi:DNA helicase-2/ATP-dependent DNA helicase PcrA
MPITADQKASAEAQQWAAAREPSSQVRLIAGPGTGKSRTIEKRVLRVLEEGAAPDTVFVISFTRATCAELRERITRYLSNTPHASSSSEISVSTMHALALRILRRANLLNQYPSDPTLLDDWEQKRIYDMELATSLGCTRNRATEIRLAHDSRWQTLDPAYLDQAQILPNEKVGFNSFHGARSNLYSCVLPGELIYKCVENMELGALSRDQLPAITHLIVDEFQDLNRCDQKFVELLCSEGAILFVAGDDDQSIYSFRHADPSGIVDFPTRYPESRTHHLTDCFRCAPGILLPAMELISHNVGRVNKSLTALYGDAAPPIDGTLSVWSFPSAQDEAKAIAASCDALIRAGMRGREDQIIILLSQINPSSIQLDPITQELSNLGLAFSEPAGDQLTDDDSLRAVYALLRILHDHSKNRPDYPAHRTLLELLAGVGPQTTRAIANLCISHSENFRSLFYSSPMPQWLTGREATAVSRVRDIVAILSAWTITDTLASRLAAIGEILSQHIFTSRTQSATPLATWLNFASGLPQEMTLGELCELLSPQTVDQADVLSKVYARLGHVVEQEAPENKIHILTMHGAKGLSGRVVFIPGAVQGIIPKRRSLSAPGLLIEQRRLFYVSLTRAMAACIISHASHYSGAAAQALAQKPHLRTTRSQFLNEMNVRSVNRVGGLSASEAEAIVADVDNL